MRMRVIVTIFTSVYGSETFYGPSTIQPSVIGATGPHAQSGFLNRLRMAVAKGGVKAVVVSLGDMALSRILRVWTISYIGGSEAGIVPGIYLLQSPNFKDVGVSITNRDGSGRILNFTQAATWILPVVNERPVHTHPLGLATRRISTALRVAEIILYQGLRRARWT